MTRSTARAVLFDRYGDRDVLYIGEIPMPAPAEDEVLVQVRAAGINPGVDAFPVGDDVLGFSWPRSSHATHTSVPVTQLIRKPQPRTTRSCAPTA